MIDEVHEWGLRKFGIIVLWIAGRETATIARIMDVKPGVVRGVIFRTLKQPRHDMSIETRQYLLDELRKHRVDGGKLHDDFFIARKLKSLQMKAVEKKKAVAPDMKTKAGRLEQRAIDKAKEVQAKISEQQRLRREAGGATKRGSQAAALEYLADRKLLSDIGERDIRGESKEISSGPRRRQAGEMLRGYIDGSRIGGLNSIDYEAAGGGSGIGLPISAHKLQSMQTLGQLRQMMSPEDFQLIEAVVDNDEFVWERTKDRGDRASTYMAIRRILDIVAVHARLMSRDSFFYRWHIRLPITEHFTSGDARLITSQLQGLLTDGKR